MADRREALAFALTRVFTNWTALKFACENVGNFREAAAKRDELFEEALSCLLENKDESYIADLLFARLEEDFHLTLEDESDRIIARMLCELRQQIMVFGNLSAALAVPESKGGDLFVLPEDEMSCDDSSDEEQTTPEVRGPKTQVVVDDQGWSTVVKRR